MPFVLTQWQPFRRPYQPKSDTHMSHNILKNDIVTALAKCWHGLERIVKKITFATSGLDWTVTGYPVNANGAVIEGWKALVRDDIKLALHVFKDSYHVIQNSDIWKAMEDALAGIPYEVVTAGSLGDCKRTFISIRLTGEKDSYVRGDKFLDYLTFINSFDGFCTARLYGSNTRVVCQNTLNMSLGDKGFLDLSVKHTSGAAVKFADMAATVQTYLQSKKAAYADLAALAERPISHATAENLLAGFLSDPKDETMAVRSLNQGKRMFQLFKTGKGNMGQTRYDLLNGVTEYYTHETNAKDVGKRLASNMLGTAASNKGEFLDLLLSDEQLNAVAARGEKLLKANQLTLA